MSCIAIKIKRRSESMDIGATLRSARLSLAAALKSPRLELTVKHICAVGSAKWFQLDVTPLDSIYALKEG